MDLEELKSKLRPVKEDDRGKLIAVSYSKLDLLKKCAMRYKLKYVDGKYSNQQTLPLELGSILHKGLELKGRAIIEHKKIDYDFITNAVTDGFQEETDKGSEHLDGINKLSLKYMEDWHTLDANGLTYNKKMDTYLQDVLYSRMEDKTWIPISTEKQFEFVYNDRCIVHGFIDRIDRLCDNPNILKVVDYKSSKKIFPETDIKTPLQMVIYDMACVFMYGVFPQYHEYDFILLDQRQSTEDGVCTKGYLSRGIKKINSLLDQIEEMEKTKEYPPSPTPLCYWCEFPDKCHTPNADSKYAGSCPYYSLWKPDSKNFKVNKEYVPGEILQPQRKIIF